MPLINRFTETTTLILDIISTAYDENSTAWIIISDISDNLPIFYISSDAIDIDVTKDLPRYSQMVNAERLTELSANHCTE